jgi:hypothetical protein
MAMIRLPIKERGHGSGWQHHLRGKLYDRHVVGEAGDQLPGLQRVQITEGERLHFAEECLAQVGPKDWTAFTAKKPLLMPPSAP